jgi:hypothetical protein
LKKTWQAILSGVFYGYFCQKKENMNGTTAKNIAKSISAFLTILFVWVLFERKLVEVFDNKILPYLSNIEFSKQSDFLFLILILFPIYTICRCVKNKYYIPLWAFLLLSFAVVIYLQYRLVGGYVSIPTVIANLGYTDILIILLTLFLISCLRSFICCLQKKKKNMTSVFIPDTPIYEPQLDILDYSESARQLAKDLETIPAENSCSLGIIAPWGTGKTSYLNLLEYHLNNDNFIVVKFDPRHSYSTKNIQEDFFEDLFSELKTYDSRYLFFFKNYLKAINIIDDSKIIPFLLDIHKIWNKESEKEKINHAIRRLNKRIVVIIEDFDRLLSDEIIEVFKLIDGNASFTNLIFITAYDKKHINDVIGKTYFNENTLFSDKFFTIEIQIPLRPYDKVYNYLLENLLVKLSVNIEDRESYKIILADHIDILKKHLTTLRDAKRFLNLFIRQFKQMQGEVEFEDYFLLYLMKYSHIDDYLNLYRKKYVATNMKANNRYFLNDDSSADASSKEIIEMLFSETSKYTLRSINNEAAFDIYFHESVYEGLMIKEMDRVFDISLKEAQMFIDSAASENKLKDLIAFLDSRNILAFENKNIFERYIDLLVYINCKNYDTNVPYLNLLRLIYKKNREQISARYEYEEQEYKGLISSKLKGNYPYYPNNITKGIVIGVINNEFVDEIIFSKKDVLKISKDALNNLIKNDSQIKQRHIDLLYSCISDIDQVTRIVSLDHYACRRIRQLIDSNPSGYLENFVGLGMITLNEDFNSVACEPFWNQLFENAQIFKAFIDKVEENSTPKLKLIKNFWTLYENNTYKPIEFQNQGNVQKKIDKNLTNEVDKFNQLLSIENKFDEYEKDRSKTPREKDDEYYLEQYQKLLNHIDGIGLYITKTGNIKRKIQDVISAIS